MSIKKFNKTTGKWEVQGTGIASEIALLDMEGNFQSGNVEGALNENARKIKEQEIKNNANTDLLQTHSSVLKTHEKDIEWLKENGGGGSGGSAPTITSTFADNTIVEKEKDVEIPIFFSSPNLGDGLAYIMIDGIEVKTQPVKQGNNKISVGTLTNLRNEVSIYVKDRTNALSNQLIWTVICGGIDLEVEFDSSADYSVTDTIAMQFNVQSASSEPIIMHLTVGYNTYEVECRQGHNEYIFNNLGVGVHKVSFYLTSGVYKTHTVHFNIVVVNANSLYVSSTFEGGTFEFGTPIPINYRISKAGNEEFTIKLILDDELVKTLKASVGSYYWTINNAEVGSHTARIEVSSNYGETVFVERDFTVVQGEYTPITTVQSGLIYRLNAEGRTNNDLDKESPTDASGNGVKTTLHNFNYFTNGWVDDALVCDGSAYVEIDCYPWADNAIYGSTIEIHYKGLDIGFEDARIIDYTDVETPYKGFYVDLNESTMKSLANTGKVYTDSDTWSTLTFVIDRKNKFGKIFINGICSRAFSLSDTGSGVSAVREDFTHMQKIFLNSRKGEDKFGACEIKDLRVYDRVLTDDEIVQNYIAQEKDIAKQRELYNKNYNNQTLPVIRMYGDTSNMTLETPVQMRIKYTSPNDELYGQSFDLPYCDVNWQGTSSLQYVLKNFTVRLKDENMADYEYTPYKNGVNETVYCFKCDYMESTHSRNTGLAKFVNECLYDSKNPAQLKNPNVRNTVNGFPTLLYINDELQGVYNFNLDRYSTKSYGYEDDGKCLVYEVSANSDTTAGAFYKWTQETGKDKLDYYKSDFECLFPPTRASGNDNMEELIRLVEWVNDASDEDFRDNIHNYFNKEYLLRYYLYVLVVGAVDSLGKNMKLATWDGRIWYPQVYDADTTIGLDNTGFLKFDMDIEMGDPHVFNTTGSKLWQKVRLLFDKELKEQYAIMRQKYFTVDNFMKYLLEEQIEQIPARYYNLDMQTKYLNFGSSYLYALHGSGEQHIRKWLRERLIYVDTLLGYNVSTSDYITLRSSKLGEVYLDIETYIPMYVRVKWRDEAGGTGVQVKRVTRGEKVRFSYNMPTATDQEIIVYGGYYLKSIGDVSNLQPTTMLIANASRLTEIECHSPNLINTDLSECTKLQRIDLSDCTALGTGIGSQPILNIQNCNYLRYCNCSNTKLTAIYTMQRGGNLEEIYYPETTQVVQVTNQTHLKKLGIPYGLISDYKPTWIQGRTWTADGKYYPHVVEEFTTEDFLPVKEGVTSVGVYSDLEIVSLYGIMNVFYIFYDENYTKLGDVQSYNQGLKPNIPTNSNFSTKDWYSRVKYMKVNVKIHNSTDDMVVEFLNKHILNFAIINGDTEVGYNGCRNLANVQITNCNNVEHIHYPFIESDGIRFESLKYVQNLILSNSLDGLKEMSFSGFNKLKTVELGSMKYLEKLGFDDMLPTEETSTLKTITVSDCPLIENVSFNVSSDNYKVAFAKGGTVDIGGMQSVKTIESNASIKGLDTLIMPIGLEYLKFSTEYGDGINEIKNLWSANSNHKDDGFKGIDLLDMEVKHIDMLGLSQVENAINFNIAPINQHPNMNTNRDGSESKPWFRPTGSINLNKYNGDMTGILKGLDLDKMEVILEVDKPNTDLTSLFESATFSNNEKIIDILSKFKNADTYKYIFKNSSLTDASEIEFNDTKLNLEGAFMNSKITADIDLPVKTINAKDCFRDCKELTSITNNWDKKYTYTIVSEDCYTGCLSADLDEVPREWGGYGFFKDSRFIYEFKMEDNLTLTLSNYCVRGVINTSGTHFEKYGMTDWGDGTVDSNSSHTYATAGIYTVKTHRVTAWGGTWSSDIIKNTLYKIKAFPSYPMNYQFNLGDMKVLKEVNLEGAIPTTLKQAFTGNVALERIKGVPDLSQLTVLDFGNLCYNNNSLEDIEDMRNWDLSKITHLGNAFNRCYALKDITPILNNNLASVKDISGCFNETTSVDHELDLSNLPRDRNVNIQNLFNKCGATKVYGTNGLKCEGHSMGAFMNMPNVTEIDLSGIDLYQCYLVAEAWNAMVYENPNLRKLNLSNARLNHIGGNNRQNLGYFGMKCPNIEELILDNVDTSEIKSFYRMFEPNETMTRLDASSMDVGSATDMTGFNRPFNGWNKLVDFYPPKNIRCNYEVPSNALSVDSLVRIMENIVDVGETKTLRMGTVNLNKLTNEQKAIALNKGWTLL